jgi:hypothetical protein
MIASMETLYMFAGTGGAFAYSVDQTGANLPEQYAPWRFLKAVSTAGRTFKAGADKAALEQVRVNGFSLSVYSVSFEPVTTIAEGL